MTVTVNQDVWPAIKSVRASRASRNGVQVAAVFAAPSKAGAPAMKGSSLAVKGAGKATAMGWDSGGERVAVAYDGGGVMVWTRASVGGILV